MLMHTIIISTQFTCQIKNVSYQDLAKVHEPLRFLSPVFAGRQVQDHMSLQTRGLQQFLLWCQNNIA